MKRELLRIRRRLFLAASGRAAAAWGFASATVSNILVACGLDDGAPSETTGSGTGGPSDSGCGGYGYAYDGYGYGYVGCGPYDGYGDDGYGYDGYGYNGYGYDD